jgi:sterol desaturase/sphingolipid hydroxylase (fatty acid hydroxylase superfamily)
MEGAIRIGAFLGTLSVLALGELMVPRRSLTNSKVRRWFANLGVVVIDTLTARLLFVAGAVGAALFGVEQGWGLLNRVAWPAGLEVLIAVIALDLALYLQHVVFHAVPALWRLHMMHHADLDMDVTTGVRFHPLEVALSMFIKVTVILLTGASPAAVLIFEVVLNASSMFNHSNIRIPDMFERILRSIIVTPDMHRIHHSIHAHETNSNFGFSFSWWDWLFGTYRLEPARRSCRDGPRSRACARRESRHADPNARDALHRWTGTLSHPHLILRRRSCSIFIDEGGILVIEA